MIRVAHFADLHYGERTLAEADRCFGAAVERAIALAVDAAVIAGDATDHALDLHAPAVERLLFQVRRLADQCPVLMLQGTFSHEPPGTLGVFRHLGGRHPVFVAERIGQVVLTAAGRWQASPGWRFEALPDDARALFSCIPTVNKAAVAATVGGAGAAQAVGEELAVLLRGYAPSHRAARAGGLPSVGVAHGTVFGAVSEHGVPMAGFDHEFTTGALFAAEAQAVLLGHLHRHQAWANEGSAGLQRLAYPGSIGRFHYGEQGDKGFLLWEIGAGEARFVLQPTPARRTLDLVLDGRPSATAVRAALAGQDIAGASVRVRWTVAEEDRHAIDRAAIERALAGAAEIRLEGRIVPVVRTRAPGISQRPALADRVRAWAEVTGVSPEPLIACLAALAAGRPEDIAAARLAADQPASQEQLVAETALRRRGRSGIGPRPGLKPGRAGRH